MTYFIKRLLSYLFLPIIKNIIVSQGHKFKHHEFSTEADNYLSDNNITIKFYLQIHTFFYIYFFTKCVHFYLFILSIFYCIFSISISLPFIPLIYHALLHPQSPHCCPCPGVPFPFCSIPPPLPSPLYLLFSAKCHFISFLSFILNKVTWFLPSICQ